VLFRKQEQAKDLSISAVRRIWSFICN